MSARAERETLAAEAAQIAVKRSAAEEELAGRARRRDDLAQRTFSVRAAAERLGERIESVGAGLLQIEARIESDSAEMARIEGELATGAEDPQADRRARLVSRLAELDAELGRERAGEVEGLESQLADAAEAVELAKANLERVDAEARLALAAVATARQAQSDADRERDRCAGELKQVERDLDQLEAFLRENGGAPAGARALADGLEVEPGCELAVAAALGGRLSAAVVDSFGSGSDLLDGAGDYGGRAIVLGSASDDGNAAGPAPGTTATRLADCVRGDSAEAGLVRALLSNSWLVDDLASVGADFSGTAVTADGRSWIGSVGELNQAPKAGAAKVLAERNRLDGLRTAASERRHEFDRAVAALEQTRSELAGSESASSAAADARRESVRAVDSAAEELRRAEWLIDARRKAPQAGPVAVERAEVAAELAAEERIAARMAAERDGSAARLAGLAERLRRDRSTTPAVRALIQSLEAAEGAIRPLRDRLDLELAGDGEEGEGVAASLRQLASQEASIQAKVAALAEQVTVAEVESQRLRDRRDDSKTELAELAGKLGLDESAPEGLLPDDERDALGARLERLERRRSQLGPVNPLAADEYQAALEHLEELEIQRKDLEAALTELKGLVRDCDRTIRETFEETFAAASDHFEDLVEKLFPGGKGRLRLVAEDSAPKPVLGGGESTDADADDSDEPDVPQMGVEIEITPAGKTMRRLSLLSGGEKSMTAIAFIFAVFLAKPCPFYILDEVEAALDDLNLGRFLELLKAYRDQAQFIVVTHQRRTMEAADALYGVSMGGDGVSKVISRKLGDFAPGRRFACRLSRRPGGPGS